jgi:integrase/recombinase XerD
MAERWRDVEGYEEAYQVSDLGQVRNVQTSKILQPIEMKNGRLYVTLCSDGFQKKVTIHSLVARAFVGPRPQGYEVAHVDTDYTNNRDTNLEYVTGLETKRRLKARNGQSVNVTKRVKTDKGLRYLPVALSANGRIKPDVVLVNGREERHPEGAYYLEWREGSKRIRLSVSKNAADAGARRLRKEAELNALNNGVPVVPENGQNGHRSVAASVAEFLDETKLTKKPKTLAAYTTALNYFQESCPKLYVEDIERSDLLKFSAFLRDEKELHPRTCWNKFSNVMSFLKAQGIRGLVGKNDWPRYVEEEPEVYEREELDTLFSKCHADERLWFEFFLMTGMREQEVMHCSWADINLSRGTVTVRYKPEYGFSPKNYREREIPIPAKLVTSLKAEKEKRDKTCGLVFPTAGCRPKLDFLDTLKTVAERAKLDKQDFWLHKFRATFATWSLWAGVDLRTVQQWLGHSDMESTMRYLKPSRSQQVREKVNEIFA